MLPWCIQEMLIQVVILVSIAGSYKECLDLFLRFNRMAACPHVDLRVQNLATHATHQQMP